jgi:hypothetical protein
MVVTSAPSVGIGTYLERDDAVGSGWGVVRSKRYGDDTGRADNVQRRVVREHVWKGDIDGVGMDTDAVVPCAFEFPPSVASGGGVRSADRRRVDCLLRGEEGAGAITVVTRALADTACRDVLEGRHDCTETALNLTVESILDLVVGTTGYILGNARPVVSVYSMKCEECGVFCC